MFLIEERPRTGKADSRDVVSALKKAQGITHGLFHPQLYAIGTQLDPKTLLRSDFRQLLKDALYRKDQTAFANLVALHHETVHMIQYLSTNAGLSLLIHYAHALASIGDAPELVSTSIIIPGNESISANTPSLPAIINFLNCYGTETGLGIIQRVDDSGGWSVRDVDMFSFQDEVRVSVSAGMKWSNPTSRTEGILPPQIRSHGPDGLPQAHALTMGLLFETSALLSELILLNDVMGEDFTGDLVWAYLDSLPYEYTVVVRLYLDHFGLDRRGFVPQLLALIDIALMQDRTVIGNHEAFTFFESLDPHDTPGSLFLWACEAAQGVSPVRNSGQAEALRFQDEVCAAMAVPPAYYRAQEGWVAAYRQAPKSGPDGSAGVFIWNRFAPIHQQQLMKRTQSSEASFLVNALPATAQSFHASEQPIAVYDLATSTLWSSQQDPEDAEAMAAVVIGMAILEPSSSGRLGCPLKEGRPFYCPSRGKGDFEHCAFSHGTDGTSPCPFLAHSASILDFQEKVRRSRQR